MPTSCIFVSSSCGNVLVVSAVSFALQELQTIDRFVVEEYLLDVLYFLNGWLVACFDLF